MQIQFSAIRDLSDLCRKLRLPCDFDVFQLCWQPDYDRFFFDQLKKRSIKTFLFRGEFIVELARTAVAEIPPLGVRESASLSITPSCDLIYKMAVLEP